MKFIIPLIIILTVLPSLSEPDKPPAGGPDKMIQHELKFRDALLKMGLEEFALMRVSGPSPTIDQKQMELLKFDVFLIDNYNDEKKVREYIVSQTKEEIYWLLKLRLAEWHFIYGQFEEAKAISTAFSEYCEAQINKQKKSQQ